MNFEKIKHSLIKIANQKISQFIFAGTIMAIKLYQLPNLFFGMDATETWKVATTFLSPNPESSYVMYKGFLAIIPNVIFYQLALVFRTDHLFFVKLFNSLCFAYITTVGLPQFFSYLFKKDRIESFKVYVLSLILFFLIGFNFTFINVDVPSLTVMLLAINSTIKISKSKQSLFYFVYTGVIFSMCTLFSGQYSLVAVCSTLFIFFSKIKPFIKNEKLYKRFFLALTCFIIGFSSMQISNYYFNKSRIEPIVKSGQPMPKASYWIKLAFTSNMLFSKYGPYIPDNRGASVLLSENISPEIVKNNYFQLEYPQYIKIIIKHPMEFLMRWLNRFFLGISVSSNNYGIEARISYLFVSYTLLFLSLLTLKKHLKKIKNVLVPQTFLVLAFIFTSIMTCLWHVEMRYFMSLNILIAGTAVFSDILWDSLSSFILFVKNSLIEKHLFNVGKISINYTFISYLIFIALCFMLFATQYELLGPDINILFKF